MSYLTESQENAFLAAWRQTDACPRWAIFPIALLGIASLALLGGVLATLTGISNANGDIFAAGAAAIGGAFLFFFAAHVLRWLQLIEWRLKRENS
ncbi:MAG: hypothetical protein ABSE57_18160 [Bryobacteraceae bacterium]|jgi:hypothetical protein